MKGHAARRSAFESAADEAIAAVMAEKARVQQLRKDEQQSQQQQQHQPQQQQQQQQQGASSPARAANRRPPSGRSPQSRSFKRQTSISEAVFDGTVGVAKAFHRAASNMRNEPMSVDGLAGIDDGEDSTEDPAISGGQAVQKEAKHGEVSGVPAPTRKEKRETSMQTMLLKDKIGFFLGVGNICLSAWWLGAHPETFYYWYTFKALVLFSSRLVVYRRLKYHYYLFEYCYIANALLLLKLWVFPHSLLFHKMIFAAVSGPLTWSIPALRNSLVLHSLDQITSLFSHLSPAMTIWTLRWHPHSRQLAYLASLPAEERAAWESSSFWELGVMSMLPYFAWALFYYLKIFVVSERKIQERGYGTLFKLMTENRKTAVAKVVLYFSKRWQPIVYMLLHLVMCWFAMTTSIVWWNSKRLHTAFVIACFAAAVWNGANYYFEIFARRYVAQLEGGGKGGASADGEHRGNVEVKPGGGMTVKQQ